MRQPRVGARERRCVRGIHGCEGGRHLFWRGAHPCGSVVVPVLATTNHGEFFLARGVTDGGYAFSNEIVPIKDIDDLKTPQRQSPAPESCADLSAAISDLAYGNDVY